MTVGCNIWLICLKLNGFFYDPSWMLHLSEFVWALRSSVWVVFNNFLLIDATDRSKIRSDQKRFFIALSLYPLSFFANTPFKHKTSNCSIWRYVTCIKKMSETHFILIQTQSQQSLNTFWYIYRVTQKGWSCKRQHNTL